MQHSPIFPAGASLESIGRFLPSNIGIAPLAAVARALGGFNREQLGSAIEVLIALLDVASGDPDAEPATWPEAIEVRTQGEQLPEDSEAVGDEADISAIEWSSAKPYQRKAAHMEAGNHEDDELIGDEQDGDDAEDEECALAKVPNGPGCPIADSDKGIEDDPHDQEQDAETEQMSNDVPMLPVFTAAHNIFTDHRVSLGISNLMTSFVTGKDVRSADSGNLHRGTDPGRKPGVPV